MTPEEKLKFIKELKQENFANWRDCDYKTASVLEGRLKNKLRSAGIDDYVLFMDLDALPHLIRGGIIDLKNQQQSI